MEKIKKMLIIISLIIISMLIAFGTVENGILLTILSFIIIYLFVEKINIKKFSIFLILFSFITKLIVIFMLNIPILADYYIMYDASVRLLSHNYSFVNDPYFLNWGYQLFHVFYQTLILKIWNNVLFLKILNCIYSTLITYFIYKISKRLSSEKTAKIISLLYSISIYPLYINCILGNQQLAFLMLIIAIYIFLFKKHNIKNLIIIGFLIGVSNLERPEGIIYLLSFIIYIILTNRKLLEITKKVLIISLTFLLVTKVPSYIMINQGFNKVGLNNTNPEWKFLIGFNTLSNGKNNIEDEKYLLNKAEEKKEIKKRMLNFKAYPKLIYNKIKIQWLYDDLEETFNVKNSSQFSMSFMLTFINYAKIINLVIIVIMFIGLIKGNKIKKEYYFWIINLIIYFGVYIFIEVSARYYYNPQISIIILSALGVEYLLDKNKRTKLKK